MWTTSSPAAHGLSSPNLATRRTRLAGQQPGWNKAFGSSSFPSYQAEPLQSDPDRPKTMWTASSPALQGSRSRDRPRPAGRPATARNQAFGSSSLPGYQPEPSDRTTERVSCTAGSTALQGCRPRDGRRPPRWPAIRSRPGRGWLRCRRPSRCSNRRDCGRGRRDCWSGRRHRVSRCWTGSTGSSPTPTGWPYR